MTRKDEKPELYPIGKGNLSFPTSECEIQSLFILLRSLVKSDSKARIFSCIDNLLDGSFRGFKWHWVNLFLGVCIVGFVVLEELSFTVGRTIKIAPVKYFNTLPNFIIYFIGKTWLAESAGLPNGSLTRGCMICISR